MHRFLFNIVKIELRGVQKYFGGNQVLRNVNLSVHEGETLVVIGRSGCGKSVMLKHIVGLFKPDRGRIFIDGEDITDLKEHELFRIRKKFGFLFQASALLDSLTVGENIGLGLTELSTFLPDEIQRIVQEKLSMVEMAGIENYMPADLSGGMKKRVGLARALAMEPEIVALANVLKKMGAKIAGAGTSVITITGVSSLNPVSTSIIPDRIEAGTFMVASALTRGDINIVDCEPDHLEAVIHKLRLTGTRIEVKENNIRVVGADEIASIDIKTLPYPGFPTDMQAQFMLLMSVAKGLSVISETIFENRFIHVSELKRLGADITIAGNTAMVKGVPRLMGAPVMATDLRASASLILAGLAAQGQTEIHRVYHLDRGYESIETKFSRLGAAIKRVS